MDLFTCCKRSVDYSLFKRSVAPGSGGPLLRFCKDCVSGNGKGSPDVYFGKEYTNGALNFEENIADPKTGKPIPFYDKASKKAAMDIAGVREVGDRKHGSRNEDTIRAGKKTFFHT